jgi:phosphoenolpyruvate synthase/pyruvate phosphate dikinase
MSMPGMMDTVLNVGLNDVVVEGLAKQVNDRFAWDCYRRLLQVGFWVLRVLSMFWGSLWHHE